VLAVTVVAASPPRRPALLAAAHGRAHRRRRPVRLRALAAPGAGRLCIALGVASAVFALWLFRLAARTRAERRWPPSAMRTSADMRIRYLTSADSLVVQMKAGAFALALAAAGMLGWGVWLLRTA
jgi:hypothetical protein